VAFGIAPVAEGDSALAARGYFVFELGDGTPGTGRIRLQNPSAKPLTVELDAVDGLTAQTGGSAFSTADSAPVAAGAWLRLDTSHITLDPGAETEVGFAVRPPPGTAPGQYLAGLAASVPVSNAVLPALTSTQAGAVITVLPRYVIGVQVDVLGDWQPSLAIVGASAIARPGGTQLEIALRNDGDTFLKAEGSVTLSNALGEPILDLPITLGTILAGTGVTYPIAWPEPPVAGNYDVDVELRYAKDRVAHYVGEVTIESQAPADEPAPSNVPAELASMPPVPAPAPVPTPTPASPPWQLFAAGGLVAVIVLVLVCGRTRTRYGQSRRAEWVSS
jgi:hypothetical protein